MDAPPIPDDGRILYFARDRAAFGFLSHFHPSPIALDGEAWPTVEHYYQTQKSFDPDYRAAIRATWGPGRAKRAAATRGSGWRAQQSWFLRTGASPRPDWDEVKLEVMRKADWAKYDQNPELAAALLATGEAELIEDSRAEPFWGVGRDGLGLNWAGRVLMEVRGVIAAG